MESSCQGGHFEYRRDYIRAAGMPSAMPMPMDEGRLGGASGTSRRPMGPLDQLGSLQLRRRTYVSLFLTIAYVSLFLTMTCVSLFLTITYVSLFLTRRYWHLATVYHQKKMWVLFCDYTCCGSHTITGDMTIWVIIITNMIWPYEWVL